MGITKAGEAIAEMGQLKDPFPYFGGKSRVAPLVWQRLGNPINYIEPFFGSGIWETWKRMTNGVDSKLEL